MYQCVDCGENVEQKEHSTGEKYWVCYNCMKASNTKKWVEEIEE